MTGKTQRRPGLMELIALLAAVIPCCLALFAFVGIEGIQDLLQFGRSERAPATVQSTAFRH